jgi:hypothetical protein
VSPLCLFLRQLPFSVNIQGSAPSPFGAGASEIPGDDHERGKSQDQGKRISFPGGVARQGKPKPADQHDD